MIHTSDATRICRTVVTGHKSRRRLAHLLRFSKGGDHESHERHHHAYTWDANGNNVSVGIFQYQTADKVSSKILELSRKFESRLLEPTNFSELPA